MCSVAALYCALPSSSALLLLGSQRAGWHSASTNQEHMSRSGVRDRNTRKHPINTFTCPEPGLQALKALESRRLVKSVKSVNNPSRKV